MDLETDTHPTVTPNSDISFVLPQEFIDLLVTKVTQSVLDKLANNTKVDDYINDSISEWMNNEFDLSDHMDSNAKEEIVDSVLYELEHRLEVESTISIR